MEEAQRFNIKEIIGHIMCSVTGHVQGESLIFWSIFGPKFVFCHKQDCCEQVLIEDICGDINDLVNTPILLAEELISISPNKDRDESCTWTFYRFVTAKGAVTVRWYGSSNGYYSESVDLIKLLPPYTAPIYRTDINTKCTFLKR